MKKHFVNVVLVVTILFTILFSSFVPTSAAATPRGLTTPDELETFLDGVFAARMKSDHTAGAVVSIVKDGELFFSKGYGYANVTEQTPVDPARTLFRIGSTSKLFVWTSIMQLVEQGKLDLDADVNTYLDFEIPATYPAPITVKNLLTHTPGFEESAIGLFVYTADQMPSLGDFLKTHLPARVFPPGEVGAYSNYGVALAGYIVERVSGMPFYEYVEKNIFTPLGMTHATFRQPLPASLAPDMAGGYNYLNGEYQQGTFELVAGYPAGSVSASAEDMAKFMIAHLQNGAYGNASGDVRILSEATARTMHGPLIEYDPRLPGMAHGFFRDVINDELVIHHGGDTIFFHTGLYLLLDQNTGLFISTNSPGGAETREAVFKAFMDYYFPVSEASLTPPADMASRAELYTGEYMDTRSNFTTLERVFTLLNPSMHATVNEEGYVLVSAAGKTQQFVEIEPGLLQSREDPSVQLAFGTLSNGKTYATTANPFSFVKAQWYESQMLHMLLLGISSLILIITLFKWVGAFLKSLFKRETQPWLAHLARLSGVAFGLLLLTFLIGFILLASDMEPVYQLPRFIFELPSTLPFVLALPPILTIFGLALALFTPVVWLKKFWNVRGRVGYTLVTLSAWVILFELVYWNFLL